MLFSCASDVKEEERKWSMQCDSQEGHKAHSMIVEEGGERCCVVQLSGSSCKVHSFCKILVLKLKVVLVKRTPNSGIQVENIS